MLNKHWYSTTAAAAQLDVTPKFLRENRLKLFKAGRHYLLKNPTSYRPSYTWHVERCRELLTKATTAAANLEQNQAAAGRGVQLSVVDGVEPYEIE